MMPPSITAPIVIIAFGSPLRAVDELREAEGAGGAALVVVGHRGGRAGLLQRLAERAAGGVPAAARDWPGSSSSGWPLRAPASGSTPAAAQARPGREGKCLDASVVLEGEDGDDAIFSGADARLARYSLGEYADARGPRLAPMRVGPCGENRAMAGNHAQGRRPPRQVALGGALLQDARRWPPRRSARAASRSTAAAAKPSREVRVGDTLELRQGCAAAHASWSPG